VVGIVAGAQFAAALIIRFWAGTHTLANDTIINNVIVHPYWRIGYWRDDSGIAGIKFANNTVSDPTGDALHFDYDATATGIVLENNIFALSSGSTARVAGAYDLSGNFTATLQSTGFTYRYNLWSTAPSAPAHTTTSNDQIGSPGFVLASGRNAEDYKLTSTSLAKDHGVTLTYVPTDYARKPRGGTWRSARTSTERQQVAGSPATCCLLQRPAFRPPSARPRPSTVYRNVTLPLPLVPDRHLPQSDGWRGILIGLMDRRFRVSRRLQAES
jgi:hypothetical protein